MSNAALETSPSSWELLRTDKLVNGTLPSPIYQKGDLQVKFLPCSIEKQPRYPHFMGYLIVTGAGYGVETKCGVTRKTWRKCTISGVPTGLEKDLQAVLALGIAEAKSNGHDFSAVIPQDDEGYPF